MEDKSIDELIEILERANDEDIRRQAVKSLGKIGTGKERAITALVKLQETTNDEYTRRQAAESLGEIGTGDERAIAALVKLLETTNNENTRRDAVESLGKIGTGNETAIAALVNLLETTNDEYTRWKVAESLGDIGTGNERASVTLVDLLETTNDEYTRWQAAESLGKIDPGNERAIAALVKLLGTTKYEYTRKLAAESLGKIDPGNEMTIAALVNLLETTNEENICIRGAESLSKIDSGNERAIAALVKLQETTNNESTWRQAAESLGKIGATNQTTIAALVNLLETTNDENTRREVAESLVKIGTGNERAIAALVNLLKTTKNKETRCQALESLGQIGTGNETAIKTLIELLDTHPSIRLIAETLEKFTPPGNSTAIEGLRKLIHKSSSAYTRRLITKLLQKLDPRSEDHIKTDEDNLLLFLTATRIKETADRYFSTNHYQKQKFCHQRILACLDQMQQGQDILTRRSLMNTYLQLYQQIVAFSLQVQDWKSAFAYTEIFRNRYIVERIAQQDTALPNTIPSELTQEIDRAKQEEKTTLQSYTNGINNHLPDVELESLSQKWEKAKQTLETLYRQVAEIEPEFIAKTKVYPLSFTEVQQLLTPDTAIIEFFLTENQLITILILPGTKSPLCPENLRVNIKINPLENLAEEWVKDLAEKSKSKNDAITETIQQLPGKIDELGKRLNFSNLQQHLPLEIKHLIVVPNNYLYLFPIHALPIKHNQRLIDCFSVRYFPNLQVWKMCQNRQRDRTSFLGIENPTQDKDLIFAKAEISSICQRLNLRKSAKIEVLNCDNAKKSTIFKAAKDLHCFHFSGHAEYNFTKPLESYLMLSENHPENLTLSNILADLHLPQADLVTLSACCTGVVDAFQATDECLGIATGFLLAGAKAVISSLWKVNSIATAFLLDEFYRQLEETQDKAVALQEAQKWLRSCSADDLRKRANDWNLSKMESKEQFRLERALKRLQAIPFENPYFWAAFILTGG